MRTVHSVRASKKYAAAYQFSSVTTFKSQQCHYRIPANRHLEDHPQNFDPVGNSGPPARPSQDRATAIAGLVAVSAGIGCRAWNMQRGGCDVVPFGAGQLEGARRIATKAARTPHSTDP